VEQNVEKKEIEIQEYSTLSLKLEGNPGTGFGWYLENKDDLLKANIKPLNLNEFLSVEFSKCEDSNLLGQGGFFDFHFKLLPGAENVDAKFVYKRYNVAENSKPLTVNIKINELKVNNVKKFGKNENSGELEIKENELTAIQIPGNATTGFLWFVENNDELKKNGIEIINLGEHNNGKYITQKPKEGEEMMVGAPGIFEFILKIEKYPTNDLPQIKFVNKRVNSTEGKKLLISLKKSQSHCCNITQIIKFEMKGGKSDFEVEKNSTFNVELSGNPTTGYSWFLENSDVIKNSKVLTVLNLDEEHNSTKTYIQDQCQEGMCGVGGKFVFEFKVGEINDKDELPQIIFGYKRPWQKDVTNYNKAEINLKIKKSDLILCFKQEGGNAELKVENNKEFKIALEGNPTTGYSWFLKNAEEIKKSGLIEELNLNEYNSAEYVQKGEGNKVGMGGVFCFKFKVKDAEAKNLPKLTFEYKRPWEKEKPAIGNAEVTLKL
jgi:predicted secreted protein